MVWEYATLELAICEIDDPSQYPPCSPYIERINILEKAGNILEKAGESLVGPPDDIKSQARRIREKIIREEEAMRKKLKVNLWVLRTYPARCQVLHYHPRKKDLSIVKNCLYMSSSSHEVVQLAANDGWEMTGGLPVGERKHFERGILLGGYDTVPMMRRRIPD